MFHAECASLVLFAVIVNRCCVASDGLGEDRDVNKIHNQSMLAHIRSWGEHFIPEGESGPSFDHVQHHFSENGKVDEKGDGPSRNGTSSSNGITSFLQVCKIFGY